MFTINSYNIFSLRTPGGDRFTEFVDALIRAEAYSQGIPMSGISTNLRTNLGDGGVDSEVRQAIPTSQTGWFSVPTCWQYKATQFKAISDSELLKEVNNYYAKELIQKNYGYRFCICDDLTPTKKSKWEKILNDEVKKLNSLAEAQVVTASDLAAWASQYPAVIVRFFKPELLSCLTFEDWGERITELTPKFVEIKSWDSVEQRIIEHTNFNLPCHKVILPIQGESGVGKTRLVYESLLTVGAISLVVYTKDNRALKIAYSLVRDTSTKAILIADECLPETQEKLKYILNKIKDRVRVICIDNSGEGISFTEQVWLTRIPENELDKILEQNFETVSPQRRLTYVRLSKGFVRLAADLCTQDANIIAQGNFGSVLQDVRSYLKLRLNYDDQKLRIIEAISLFQKVGYRDNVKAELEELCQITSLKLDKENLLEIASRLKDIPGFFAFAGRYIYITPEIIAQVTFEGAWQRWIEYDPDAFLSQIPVSLIESFLYSVSTRASQENRSIVARFFRNLIAEFKPNDLTDFAKVNRLVILVKTDPEYYFPRLAQIIDKSSEAELLKVSGGYWENWGTRRLLVWLVESIAAFPEFFFDAESILWKLALAETEPNLANNATRIWQQLFQILNSGTATPFITRIKRLEERLFTENKEETSLALEGLSNSLKINIVWSVVDLSVFAGRIVPKNWQPENSSELKECLDLAVNLLIKVASADNSFLRLSALQIAIQHLRTLLLNNYLDKIKTVFIPEKLPEDILLSLINKLEYFVRFNPNLNVDIQQWLQNLTPNNLHGRLIQILSQSPWSHSRIENQESWYQEIDEIAQQFCQNPELLISEMKWLCSPQAISSWALGNALGKYDTQAVCLKAIMNGATNTSATDLAREYISSLVINYPRHIALVNNWIDKLETQVPKIAYELFMAGGHATKAIERTLNLIDKAVLPLAYLDRFSLMIAKHQLSAEDFGEILKPLIQSVKEEKNISAIETTIRLVSHQLRIEETEKSSQFLAKTTIQNLIWELLEATTEETGREYESWAEIIIKMAKYNIEKVARITSSALVTKNDEHKFRAEEILIDLAKDYPEIVIEQIGEIILYEQQGWHFLIAQYPFLIQPLPLDTVKKWLSLVGVEGARKIAEQLPIPYINQDGKAVVPPLTEFVFSEFKDDDETFQKFCYSSHNLQVYSGDIKAHKKKEAEDAKKFLNHPLRRIKEWALYEIDNSKQEAEYWHQIDNETSIP
ncbi:MAG: hypothetical protein WBA93_27040 [Microcoleaceae cyanobacterium]